MVGLGHTEPLTGGSFSRLPKESRSLGRTRPTGWGRSWRLLQTPLSWARPTFAELLLLVLTGLPAPGPGFFPDGS